MQRLYRSGARRARSRAAIKRADSEAIQIKCPQSEEKGDNKESGRLAYIDQGSAYGRRRAAIKRAGAEAIQIKGPQMEG